LRSIVGCSLQCTSTSTSQNSPVLHKSSLGNSLANIHKQGKFKSICIKQLVLSPDKSQRQLQWSDVAKCIKPLASGCMHLSPIFLFLVNKKKRGNDTFIFNLCTYSLTRVSNSISDAETKFKTQAKLYMHKMNVIVPSPSLFFIYLLKIKKLT
jgi:hypothetical protein